MLRKPLNVKVESKSNGKYIT